MTVRDLIALLETLPADAVVGIHPDGRPRYGYPARVPAVASADAGFVLLVPGADPAYRKDPS